MTQQILVPSLERSDWSVRFYRRELPVPGSVLVTVGQEVEPHTHIASAVIPGHVMILRVTQQLGLEAEEIIKTCSLKEGDQVMEGDLIASHKGLFGFFSSEVRSPYTGSVEFISPQTGHVGIRLPETVHTLSAYVKGRVEELIGSKGAIIKASGGYVQGVFGVGGERFGHLKAIPVKPDEMVRRSAIPDNCSGSILFGGASVTTGALELAAEKGAVGIITGSIDDAVLHAYVGYEIGVAVTGDEEVPLTLIVTEGFGTLPMSHSVLELLNRHIGSSGAMNGATQVRAGAVRPELMVFHDTKAMQAAQHGELRVGASIRLIRHPFYGKTAVIESLPPELTKIETGAHVRVLTARLESGEMITVPRANTEIIST